jgi:hypothetical protein
MSEIYNTAMLTEKLATSNAWVARAIYRLASAESLNFNRDSNQKKYHLDKEFFVELKKFFIENGHFTDRQIILAKRKIRFEYVEYLVGVINDSQPSFVNVFDS